MLLYTGNVVVIAGGTGGFTASKGLKHYTTTAGLTIVVSGADDGGSTGRLRRSYGIQPPGDARKVQEALADAGERELLDKYGPLPETDVRRSLVALADDNGLLRSVFGSRLRGNGSLKGKSVDELLLYTLKDVGQKESIGRESIDEWSRKKRETIFNPDTTGEMVVRQLRSHTFNEEDDIEGHSVGNLLITALTHITGSYVEALDIFSRMLKLRGTVLPVTLDNVTLHAELDNGELIDGETNIDIPKHDLRHLIERGAHWKRIL